HVARRRGATSKVAVRLAVTRFNTGVRGGAARMVRGAGWLVAAALAAGCATDNSGVDNAVNTGSQIGKVRGIYVEQYGGIYVDQKMAGNAPGQPVWVYVTFDRPLPDGTRFATAILEQDSGVEPGDLVQLRLAGTDKHDPAAA